MCRIVIFIPKLPKMTKSAREKWFLKNYGSGVMNSGYVLFIEV